jgi:hypothetical protein
MSRRVVRIQDALTDSSVLIVESVEPLAHGIKNTGRAIKACTGGAAEWLEDWEDSVVDGKAVKKLERAFTLRQRARALELEEAAFNALPSVS